MDEPKKRRFRFGLRTLLAVVALVGVGLYFRPGQVNPRLIPSGASKAWVYWNCGKPDCDFDRRAWHYDPHTRDAKEEIVFVRYDGDGRAEEIEVISVMELVRQLSQ